MAGMDLNVVNNALVAAAQNPVKDLNATSNTVGILQIYYDDEVNSAFSAFRWNWCSTTEPLIRVNTTQATQSTEREDYEGLVMYERPNNAISINDIWIRDSQREAVEYERGIFQNRRVLYAPNDNLVIRFVIDRPVSEWPTPFKTYVEHKLAVRLAERFKTDKVAELKENAQMWFEEARRSDLRQIGSNKAFAPARQFTGVRNVFDGGGSLRRGRFYRTTLRYVSGGY